MNNENKNVTRILHIIGSLENGGVESVVYNYYRYLDKTKFQFDFVVDKTSIASIPQNILDMGVKVYSTDKYTKIFSYITSIIKVCKEGNYKIVHSHLNTMSIFPLFAAWRAKVPVRICHNHSTASWAEPKKTLLKYILRPFNKIFATDYFACSEKAGRWMYGNKNFDNNKVFVMPNAIDIKKFKFDESVRQKIRREFHIEEKNFVVGHVGRFTFAKNHLFLIDIFNSFYQKDSNSILLLVGDGDLENEIREKVKQLKLEENVLFAGARNDVNKLYSVMDVFLFPSFYEGLGIAAIEAQISGLSVVASDRVPKEVNITNNVEFLSIEKSAMDWAAILFNTEKKSRNIVALNKTALSGYDITLEVPRLEKKYYDYLEKFSL